MDSVKALYEQHFCQSVTDIKELPSSGSHRRYFRISGGGGNVIGTSGTSVEENRAFWAIAEHFRDKKLNVPRVIAHNENFTCYLQEDLGDTVLYDVISDGRDKGSYSEEERDLLKKTVAYLPLLQYVGAEGMDFSVCYPQTEFDRRMIAFDLNYFKYCFLKSTGLDFNENILEDDFTKMGDVLMRSSSDTFMYRDFQARNVMLHDGKPYFIDFQGGRRGPIYYDVASFMWQAKANYSEELREELISTYLDSLKKYISVNEKDFNSQLRHFVLFRMLQVLGAYGFRGYFEKKPHFLKSVPYAIDNLRVLLKEPFAEYPYLSKLLLELTEMRQFSDMEMDKKLVVRIFSFAYKKGIPNDVSGNGGGYVFDCRAINNPGKYEHFFHFNGTDKEVIDFLEKDGGIVKFLENIYPLADTHVQRYIQRKFNSLMFSFGCTGGQHRSVYCAEHLADYLSKKYDIKVLLYHRELGLEKEY